MSLTNIIMHDIKQKVKDYMHAVESILNISEYNSWAKNAELAAICIKSGAWKHTHNSASDWVADAASRTKSTLNTFRRQIRIIEFLISIEANKNDNNFFVQYLPFGPLEILMRLHKINPEKANDLLPRVISGSITNQKLKDLYKDVHHSPKGRSAFASRSQQFESWALTYIESHIDFFNGDQKPPYISFDTKTKNFPYGRADFWAITNEYVDAFEIKLFGADDNKFILIRTLEQINLMSSFHRIIWVIYPKIINEIESHRKFINQLCKHIKLLNLTNIGVAQISENVLDSKPEIKLIPQPHNAPRSELLRNFINNPTVLTDFE